MTEDEACIMMAALWMTIPEQLKVSRFGKARLAGWSHTRPPAEQTG